MNTPLNILSGNFLVEAKSVSFVRQDQNYRIDIGLLTTSGPEPVAPEPYLDYWTLLTGTQWYFNDLYPLTRHTLETDQRMEVPRGRLSLQCHHDDIDVLIETREFSPLIVVEGLIVAYQAGIATKTGPLRLNVRLGADFPEAVKRC